MEREWRLLKYQGCEYCNFSISNAGELRNNSTSKVLKPSTNENGYYVFVVRLHQNGKKSGVVAHRAVAETFIDNPCKFPQINHKDGNKQNNNVENLEWCTCSENIRHAVKNQLLTTDHCRGALCNFAKLNEEQVKAIRRLYMTGDYTQKQLAELYNCSKENIKSIVNFHSWRHIGS